MASVSPQMFTHVKQEVMKVAEHPDQLRKVKYEWKNASGFAHMKF